MRFFTTFYLLLVVCTGCQPPPVQPAFGEWRAKLHTVTLADGISQSEAQIIGACYFAKQVGCGAFHGVQDGGDRWVVDGSFGYAAAPVRDFYIDKRTGKITSTVGPSYDNPLEIFP